MLYITVRIARHERGLVFRAGDLVGVLLPGRHRVRGALWGAVRDTVETLDTTRTRLVHPRLDLLVQDTRVREHLEVVNPADHERAIVWKDGRVHDVIGPGRYAYWKEPAEIRIETHDTTSLRLEHPRLAAVAAVGVRNGTLGEVTVEPSQDVLIHRDGRLVERVTEGRYVYWTGVAGVRVHTVDRREQVLDVAGQEIMTKDKVTLRVNLVVTYRVSDPVAAVTVTSDASQTLYREAQLALRAAVGTRDIDVLLSDKESVGGEVANTLSRRAAEIGVAVRSVGLRDIVLPGDMKEILNRVITARKEAEANVIRRREETAAMRSQANTAKMLADNPILTRLKELEMLQEILAGSRTTFVLGQGDMSAQIKALVGSTGAGE